MIRLAVLGDPLSFTRSPSLHRAGLAALTGPQDEVHKMVAEFDARRKVVVAGLNKLPGVSCATPKGAFYAFPNIKRTGWKAKPLASALLDDAGVANGPINTIAEVFKEPQVIARGLKIELPHAVAGKVPLVASPMRFSETPIKHEIPPPAVGQHTDEILRGVLKKTDAEIAGLRGGGVV
mgnify:CR=1 FL=1